MTWSTYSGRMIWSIRTLGEWFKLCTLGEWYKLCILEEWFEGRTLVSLVLILNDLRPGWSEVEFNFLIVSSFSHYLILYMWLFCNLRTWNFDSPNWDSVKDPSGKIWLKLSHPGGTCTNSWNTRSFESRDTRGIVRGGITWSDVMSWFPGRRGGGRWGTGSGEQGLMWCSWWGSALMETVGSSEMQ